MRKLIPYLFVISSFTLFAQQKVKIHVTFTNQYCGGAAPTDEILESYNKPQNLSDFIILIEGKKHFKVKTDSTGTVKVALKAGIYKVYLTKKTNEKLYTNYNPGCEKMLHNPYGKLQIESVKKEYELNLHFSCNPCELPKP